MSDANLLIIHQGALGDFILTFPAITRLHQYFDQIDVLCQSQPGRLAQHLGIVVNSYSLEAAYVASLFTDQIDAKMKNLLKQFENVILFSLSDQLEHSIRRVSGNLRCRLPTRPPVDQRIHVAEFILDNLSKCGLIKEADATLDDLPLPVRRKSPRKPRNILLHPGAGSVRKRWPLSNFLNVESMLQLAGLEPEFVIGPAERDLVEEFQQPDRRLHVLDDVLELLDLFKFAGGYIGNDSGASHLAAYSGLPTTVIFGPADPERWKPIGRSVQIVRPGLQCRPCFETEPDNCDGLSCLVDTSPQKVMDAFFSVYQR
jgi:ADP-heptose:LPS heptosyltransferase